MNKRNCLPLLLRHKGLSVKNPTNSLRDMYSPVMSMVSEKDLLGYFLRAKKNLPYGFYWTRFITNKLLQLRNRVSLWLLGWLVSTAFGWRSFSKTDWCLFRARRNSMRLTSYSIRNGPRQESVLWNRIYRKHSDLIAQRHTEIFISKTQLQRSSAYQKEQTRYGLIRQV